ncbi:MAG: DUF4838 domain-containing protein [Nitrospira sp.]|nr:DUF4838 domain-containing protein [Nitrospira sp.]
MMKMVVQSIERSIVHLVMTRIFCAGLACAFLLTQPTLVKAQIVVAKDGNPAASIVIARDALGPARRAAQELQLYIRKITGGTLPILLDDADIIGPMILVGESGLTRKRGLNNADFKPQEYLIRLDEETLILMGRDESEEDAKKVPGTASMIWPFTQAIGSQYAVSAFLEKCCGVRWYMPTDLGEVVPVQKTLRVEKINIRRQPSTRHRSALNFQESYEGMYPATLWQWGPKGPLTGQRLPYHELQPWALRLKMCGEPFNANHGQSAYAERFGTEHPDWFAHGEANTGNQLCYSNPEVFKQVVQDARDFFDRGELTPPRQMPAHVGIYYSVMPADSANWCECERCGSKVTKSPVVSLWYDNSASEYVWDFVARVAREVGKTHPDKFIACAAYWSYSDPPKNVELPANVVVVITKKHASNWHPRFVKNSRDRLSAWKQEGIRNIYFWDYYFDPEGVLNYEAFPSIAPHAIAQDVAAMKQAGADGGQIAQLLLEGTSGENFRNMAIDHLRLYVTMKLLDDWDQNVDAILEEYYRLFYGPAEKPVRAFFERIEQAYYDPRALKIADKDGIIWPEAAWTKLCPPEELKRFGDLIAEARTLTAEGSIYRRRVDFIDEGLFRAVMVSPSEAVRARIRDKRPTPAPPPT